MVGGAAGTGRVRRSASILSDREEGFSAFRAMVAGKPSPTGGHRSGQFGMGRSTRSSCAWSATRSRPRTSSRSRLQIRCWRTVPGELQVAKVAGGVERHGSELLSDWYAVQLLSVATTLRTRHLGLHRCIGPAYAADVIPILAVAPDAARNTAKRRNPPRNVTGSFRRRPILP